MTPPGARARATGLADAVARRPAIGQISCLDALGLGRDAAGRADADERLRRAERIDHGAAEDAAGCVECARARARSRGDEAQAPFPPLAAPASSRRYRELFLALAEHGAIGLGLYRAAPSPSREAGLPYTVLMPKLETRLDIHDLVFFLQPAHAPL